MRNLLITALCGLTSLPTLSIADDHGHTPPPPSYHHDGGYRYGGFYRNYYGYGAPYPYYYRYDHHHDNDDAWWVIGGLVLGGIIGSAIEHSPATYSAAMPAPPPTGRPAQRCYDSIVYDSAGNPRVQRTCY